MNTYYWYNYEYITSGEIFKSISNIKNYWIIDIIILVIIIWIILTFIFYILPKLNNFMIKYKKEKETKIKKQMMNKIILQKDLEDSISKELHL